MHAATPPRRRRSERAPDGPPTRYLVVHEDGTNLLAIKRALETSRAVVIGARSPELARKRLQSGERFDALLMAWELPDYGGPKLAWMLRELRLHPRPYVIAFAASWPRDDLSRAIQLGVDAFVPIPVDPRAVHHELEAVRNNGIAPSRAMLLDKMGHRLLRKSDALWDMDVDPAWRERMQVLADRVTGRRRGGRQLDRAEHVLRCVDEASGRPIGVGTAEALVTVGRKGVGVIPDVARTHGLGATRLTRLHRTVIEGLAAHPASHSGENVEVVLSKVLQRVRERARRIKYSPAFKGLRRDASALLLQIEPGPEPTERFLANLAGELRVEPTVLAALDAPQIRYVAALIVNEPLEKQAIDMARLVVLGQVLRGLPAEVDQERLRTLAAMLGCDARGEEDQDARLVIAASEIEEALMLEGVNAVDREQLQRALADASLAGDADGPNPVEVARRLGRVLDATLLNGEVSRRRFGKIIDLMERDEPGEVCGATRQAIIDHVELPPAMRRDEVARLWEQLGIEGAEHGGRIAAALADLSPNESLTTAALRGLADAAQTPEGLTEWQGQQALNEPRPSTLAQGAQRAHLVDLVELLDLDPRVVDRVDPEALLEAMEGQVLDASLSPEELLRLRTLAVTLKALPESEREALLERFLDAHESHPSALVAAMELLGVEGLPELSEKVRARLKVDAVSADAAGVLELLEGGNLGGAWLLARDLDDGDPRTVAVLSQLAAALHHVGRLGESAELYERALSLQPRRLTIALSLARVRLDLGAPTEALDLLDQVKATMPGFGDSDALEQRARAALAA